MSDYKPVPVEAAREIAEKYDKSIVIVFSHDPVHGVVHTTTYGSDPQNKAWAAQGGEIATRALGGLPELKTEFEDYRLSQARKLLGALRNVLTVGNKTDLSAKENRDRFDKAIADGWTVIHDAEKFLG